MRRENPSADFAILLVYDDTMAVDDIDAGMAGEKIGDVVERARQEDIVGIQIWNYVVGAVGECEIGGVRLTAVGLGAQRDPVANLAQPLERVVARPGVLHEILEPRITLLQHAAHGAGDESPLIEGRRRDGDSQRRIGVARRSIPRRYRQAPRLILPEAPQARPQRILDPVRQPHGQIERPDLEQAANKAIHRVAACLHAPHTNRPIPTPHYPPYITQTPRSP